MNNTYALGNDVVCSALFRSSEGVVADPDTVSFSFRNGDGDVTTYVYGTDAEVVKDSVGNYHVNVDASARGTWHYRFYSTGTGKAADEKSFKVVQSNFD